MIVVVILFMLGVLNKMSTKWILLGMATIFLVSAVMAVRNPSAVYCHEMGYEYVPEGICKLPDGSEVIAWEFLRGEVGQEYSYCAEQGYEMKTINDSKKCSSIYSHNCGVCVLDSGEEVEVSKLMNLDFSGGIIFDDENLQDLESKRFKFRWWYILIGILAVLVIVGIVYFVRENNKQNMMNRNV